MKTFSIQTNADQDLMLGRNGGAKLSSILVDSYGNSVDISGINSRGSRIANSGFRLKRDPRMLRELAAALTALADEAEKQEAA